MSEMATDDPVLARFRSKLREIYGDRLERAVLYGSRARGDAGDQSDYDIAVFLHNMPDRWAEMNRLADLGTDILYDEGRVIHAMAYPAGTWRRRTPLMHEIRREGRDL
ncbi:MAG TPA: nucleotidyltransferase domain-containing protein [Acetobacteraceae bacterium]|nr:nucleotidyltransferase domain-containing protein [Acetobacteraceae bacterium]